MRWSYLIPRLIIIALVWAFFAFAFDPLVRKGAVATGQSMAGAKVDIDSAETTFFPPTLALNNVQVANRNDPWKNLFEFESFQLKLAGKPLLRKSIIVEEASINGLRWNTPRETSGELSAEELERSHRIARFVRDKAHEIAGDWYDDFIKRMKMQLDPKLLASVKLAKSLRNEWTQRFNRYEKQLASFETQVKQIEKTAKSAKGNTFQKIQAYQTAIGQVNRLLIDLDRTRRELEALPKVASTDFARIETARKQDEITIRNRVRTFTHPNAESITAMLLGPTIQQKLDTAAEWAQWARQGLNKLSKKKGPRRLRGTTVRFRHTGKRPRFLIRKLHVSGNGKWKDEPMTIAGTITGITSDPKLYGKPLVVQLEGKSKTEWKLTASANETGETAKHRVRLQWSDPTSQSVRLGKSRQTALVATAGRTTWTADVAFVGDDLSGAIRFIGEPVTIRSTDPQVAKTKQAGRFDFNPHRMLYTAASSIRRIEASIILSGTTEKPRWRLESDLGRQIAAGINLAIDRELQIKQRQLTAEMNGLVKRTVGKFAKDLNSDYAQVFKKLNVQKIGAQQLVQRLAGGRLPVKGLPFDLNHLPLNQRGKQPPRRGRGFDWNQLFK